LDLPKIFGIHLFLCGVACFGFGAFHVTSLYGPGIHLTCHAVIRASWGQEMPIYVLLPNHGPNHGSCICMLPKAERIRTSSTIQVERVALQFLNGLLGNIQVVPEFCCSTITEGRTSLFRNFLLISQLFGNFGFSDISKFAVLFFDSFVGMMKMVVMDA